MKPRLFLAAVLLLSFPFVSKAQLSTASISPQEDSIAFADMRSRMDRIRRIEHRPTVALVLSGGGAKGSAHVGALKYIEELEIPIDMVLGTSMGGLVGGLYSLGYDAAYLDSLLTSVDWKIILSDKVPQNYISYATKVYKEKFVLAVPFHYSKDAFFAMTGLESDDKQKKEENYGERESEIDIPINNIARSLPAGYINGLNVNNVFSSMSAGYQDSISFRDLPIPFCCVASDMVSCKAKNWTSGSITEALRSTMSIPGLFDPVKTHGMVLVDGGTRNNFPTDIAREMGADYVIGVELSDEDQEYDDINNIADILWNFIDMLGREAFSKNVGNTDVFIKPDLKGFNMLSFDSESVATIIDRGYEAAVRQKDALMELKAQMPDSKTEYKNRPADDINRSALQIRSIEFEGMDDRESRFLSGKIKFKAGDHIDKAAIDNAVSIIFATGSFESVTYRLSGDEQPYRLIFNCIKRPIHQLGFGYRADNETLVDVILNVGLNAHKIAGAKLDLTGKLGQNKFAEAHFSFDMPKTPTINITAKVGGNTGDIVFDDVTYRIKYWSHKEEAYLSNMHWTKFDFNAGIRNERFGFLDWLSNGEDAVDQGTMDVSGGNFTSAFVTGRAYTFDNGYFPTRGIDLNFGYQWLFRKSGAKDFNAEHIGTLNFRDIIRFGNHVAFLYGVHARAILNAAEAGLSNLPYKNFVGGTMSGRYAEQQIPFCGWGGAIVADDYTATADASLRFRFGKNIYTTFQGGYFRTAHAPGEFIGDENLSFIGGCFELAYNTLVGPLKVDVRWSDMTDKVGVYLGFGYDF